MSDTSHDRLRNTVIKHGITRAEIRHKIVFGCFGQDAAGEDRRVDTAIDRFLAGGSSCIAVAAAIISLVVDRTTATKH